MDEYTGVSHTYFPREFYSSEGKNEMSLCFGLIYGSTAYIVADSRSSFTEDTVLNVKKFVSVDSDDYRKIALKKIGNDIVAHVSTGQNKFCNKTFTEIISEIPEKNSIEEYIDEVNRVFMRYRLEPFGIAVTTLFYKNRALCEHHFPDKSDKYVCYDADSERLKGFWQGAKWGQAVFELSYFDPNFYSEESVISQINAVFDKIERLSNEFDKSIGGPIHIGKLTPEGFTWLQNGYEL